MIFLSDEEIYVRLFEGAVNVGALIDVLVCKGVLTVQEVEVAKIRVRAELDQAVAERSQQSSEE